MAAKKIYPETLTETFIKFMSVSLDTKFAIARGYDDWTFKQIFADRKRKSAVKYQRMDIQKHAKLGSDLATAHFAVKTMFGRVRDQRGIWIDRGRNLPPDYSKAFRLTAIDVSNRKLVTEGVDNFVGLEYIESLDLSTNPALDDFACDQLSRQFRMSKTLSAIDLSYNPLISVYGLEILLRIPSLRNIVALETQASKFANIDLFTIAAEDERQCSVFVHSDGRQFRSQELESTRLNTATLPRLKAVN